MTKDNSNFIRFAIPIDIEKGVGSNGNSTYIFKGLATTPSTDRQGETLLAHRYDLSDFKDVNWNHKAKDDANAYLGQITSHEFQKGGLYVKGELFEEMPMTNAVVNLMKALNRRGKKLQLSVEGQVIKRGSNDPKNPAYKIIEKAKLTGVAITNNPINADTFCELIEKGYTEHTDWSFEEEDLSLAEEIIKSMDIETDKPFIGESVDGAKKKNLKDAEEARKKNSSKSKDDEDEDDDEDGDKKDKKSDFTSDKKVLSKSLAYEAIFKYFYPVDIQKAKVIYQLLEKISTMSKTPITAETLKKAQDILNLAASSDTKTLVSAKEHISSLEDKTLSKAEVLASLLQEGYEEELAKSAVVDYVPETKTAGADTTEIAKALNALSFENATQRNDITVKFGAIGLILKSQTEAIEQLSLQNEELKKSNDALTETLNAIKESTDKISKTPVFKTPTVGARGVERFEKSEDGKEIFNVSDKAHRAALASRLEELSGFSMKEANGGRYNESLMKASQEIEMIGAFSDSAMVPYLANVHKIQVVKE